MLKHLRESRRIQIFSSGAFHRPAIFVRRMFPFGICGIEFGRSSAVCGSDRRRGNPFGRCRIAADCTRSNLSSYAPANGGALDIFVGSQLHDYFSVQGDFIWNRNSLRLNSASSSTGTFYQEDRGSSQKAVIFSFLLYFRRRSSRIRPYLGIGTGIAHLFSAHERLSASAGAATLPPEEFSSTGPVLRTHVGIDLKLIRKVDFRYSFSETIGSNEISKNLSPPGSRGLANFQNLFGFVVRF